MKRFLLLALVAVCCLAAAKKKPAAPTVPPGTLGGRVYSRSAAPVTEAAVHVWKEKEKKETATIKPDEKGEFRFPIAEGTYEVQATAAGKQPAVPTRIIVVVHQQQVTWVNLEMVP
ncbi:MAG TPA: carboxypeptidase-like regulatory domain-containing protein [Thermoanaerobaculia bacterium]|nr:carboxypeptidase-like regulatory domain-containing protein [Thermoanaerobaculia bacterium]